MEYLAKKYEYLSSILPFLFSEIFITNIRNRGKIFKEKNQHQIRFVELFLGGKRNVIKYKKLKISYIKIYRNIYTTSRIWKSRNKHVHWNVQNLH